MFIKCLLDFIMWYLSASIEYLYYSRLRRTRIYYSQEATNFPWANPMVPLFGNNEMWFSWITAMIGKIKIIQFLTV